MFTQVSAGPYTAIRSSTHSTTECSLLSRICVNLYVDFTPAESDSWQQAKKKISDTIRSLEMQFPELKDADDDFLKQVNKLAQEGSLANRLMKLLSARRQLLAEAENRIGCQSELLDWLSRSSARALVFHETIATAEESREVVRHLGVSAALDHSQLPMKIRKTEEERFRRGGDACLHRCTSRR